MSVAERDRRYRNRTGRERPPDPWPEPFLARWRECNRAAGLSGAWTHLPSGSAVAALRALAEHGPTSGTDLAPLAGIDQPNLTARTLPRLADLDLVTWQLGEGRRERGPFPRVWSLTAGGRALVALLDEPAA